LPILDNETGDEKNSFCKRVVQNCKIKSSDTLLLVKFSKNSSAQELFDTGEKLGSGGRRLRRRRYQVVQEPFAIITIDTILAVALVKTKRKLQGLFGFFVKPDAI
jgi:hypothetical protein